MEDVAVFHAENVAAWRKWLADNHQSKTGVWLVYHKKSSSKKSITWSESVDVALCYGWIDGKKIKIDADTSHQYFTKRNPKSGWSKINKDKIAHLLAQGLMSEAGLASIEIAKQNGSWELYDAIENLEIPVDLTKIFKQYPGTEEYFLSLSKSNKKFMLHYISSAKRPETRLKRLHEVADKAGKHQKMQ
ncbi:MAG: hypothetical protein EOO99_09445 [Pedobacter sp.]|nr:MAG: hypothetical protein EOO99_09445 [Pedobacter sp.]